MFFQIIVKSLRYEWRDFIFKEILFCLLLCSFTYPISAQPKAEVLQNKMNFGLVKRGELVELKYEVINSGLFPLLLINAEVSCSCTIVEFSNEPLMPGKKTTILVKFNTKSVWGRQDRVVYIKCNDKKGEFALRYKGQVSKE